MFTNHRSPSDSELVKFHALMQGKVYQCLASSTPHCAQMLTFLLFYKELPQTLRLELALLLKPQQCMQLTLT